jgi:hypothetical protein
MWQGMAPSAEDDYFAQVDAEARADREDRMDDILGDYWVVYVSGLSRTVRAHVEALLVDAHDPAYIASRRGHTDPETASLAWLLTRLHQVWCHWDSASPAEMLSMMRDYLDVVSVAPGEVIQA